MRRSLFVGWTVLMIGLPVLARQNAPGVAFDAEVKDFGTVVEGHRLQHVFKFTNKGQGTLEILSVQPG